MTGDGAKHQLLSPPEATIGFEPTIMAALFTSVRVFLAAVLIASVVLASGSASAGSEGSEFLKDPSEEAHELLSLGRKLQRAGEHETALPLLRKALQLQKRPDIAAALGETELALKHYVDAVRHLSYALSLMPPEGASTKRATEQIKRARQHVATLRLRVEPAETQVIIDGDALPDHRGDVYVSAGMHTIIAKLEGYHTTKVRRRFKPVVSEKVDLVLARKPDDGADETSSTPLWPFIAGIGSGVTLSALVTGIVLTTVASSHDDDAQQKLMSLGGIDNARGYCMSTNDATCAEVDEALASHDRAADGATAMWIMAAVLGTGTVVGAVLSEQLQPGAPAEPSATVRLAPAAGPGFGGLFLQGRW